MSSTTPPSDDTARMSLSTRSVHADDHISAHRAVAPAMHVSSTFRYDDDPAMLQNISDPNKHRGWENIDPAAPFDSHVYSRDSSPNTTRLEAGLTSVLGGPSLTYTSGLAAFHAMLVHLNPRCIAISDGYHGCLAVVDVHARLSALKKLPLDCDVTELGPGDVIHVETPLNPTGEARNIQTYFQKARQAGAILTVDATLAPPPLQDPIASGADIVLHSGTKYLGGHDDLLCGVLTLNPARADWKHKLLDDRLVLGAVMGNMESWLCLRSLRTLELRVTHQSDITTRLVRWLQDSVNDTSSKASLLVQSIHHASIQSDNEADWVSKQMPGGYGAVFAITMKTRSIAKQLPSSLKLFGHATSLGGVRSLIEWRAMTDATCDQRLLRVSIGVESFEDLKNDWEQAFESLNL